MSDIHTNTVGTEQADSFDPRAYTIIVRRVLLEGEHVFHGRVMELPDLEAFEPTYEEAYAFLVDGIRNVRAIFEEEGKQIPDPLPDETPEYSGRVTLRMPAWLHAQLDFSAKAQQTSLNQHMVTLLSWAAAAAPTWVAQNQLIGSTLPSCAAMGTTWSVSAVPYATVSGNVGAQVTTGLISPTRGLQDLHNMQLTVHGGGAAFTHDYAAHMHGEFTPEVVAREFVRASATIKRPVFARTGRKTSR